MTLSPLGYGPYWILLRVYVAEMAHERPSWSNAPLSRANSTPSEICLPALTPATTPCALSAEYWICPCVVRKNGVTFIASEVPLKWCSHERSVLIAASEYRLWTGVFQPFGTNVAKKLGRSCWNVLYS